MDDVALTDLDICDRAVIGEQKRFSPGVVVVGSNRELPHLLIDLPVLPYMAT